MPSPYIETISLYSEDRANADSRAFRSRQIIEDEDFTSKKKKKGITRLDTEEEEVRCKRKTKVIARSSSQQTIGRSRRVSAQGLR